MTNVIKQRTGSRTVRRQTVQTAAVEQNGTGRNRENRGDREGGPMGNGSNGCQPTSPPESKRVKRPSTVIGPLKAKRDTWPSEWKRFKRMSADLADRK